MQQILPATLVTCIIQDLASSSQLQSAQTKLLNTAYDKYNTDGVVWRILNANDTGHDTSRAQLTNNIDTNLDENELAHQGKIFSQDPEIEDDFTNGSLPVKYAKLKILPIPIADWRHTSDKKGKKGETYALVIGFAVGLGAPVLLASIIILFWLYRRCRRRKIISVFESRSTRDPKTLSTTYQSSGSQNLYLLNTKQLVYEDDKWQMDISQLIINYDEVLGTGAFSTVYKGKILGEAPVSKLKLARIWTPSFHSCECAIKVLPAFADVDARKSFIQEIDFMKNLQYHPHLISMLGWVNDFNSPMLVVEYCHNGDLLHFLRSKKEEFKDDSEHNKDFKANDLVSFGWQISNGLEYLSSLGCIHRDIAARNVLIDAKNIVKVSDFGLCRFTDSSFYTSHGGRLPIKWMAPESLELNEFSHKTDVWSYGVLLYEIFSFGNVPYPLVKTSKLLEFLKCGKRLEKPTHCPVEIYSMMQKCWDAVPSYRPSFTEICQILAFVLESTTESYGYVVAVEDCHIATHDKDSFKDKTV